MIHSEPRRRLGQLAEIVVFDRSAACTFTARKVAVEKDPNEDHSDVTAEFGVTCATRRGNDAALWVQ